MFIEITKKSSFIKICLLLLLSSTCLTSCFEDAEPDGIIGGTGRVPAVFSFEPSTAEPGQRVTITGNDLSSANLVTFNGAEGEIESSSDNSVVVIVPPNATTGQIEITTTNGVGRFRENFTVFIDGAPIIDEISPKSALAGEVITLKGSLMNAISSISVGGVEVSSLSVSQNEVTFIITEGSEPGLSQLNITSSVGISTTDTANNPFFVYEILNTLAETFDADENVLSHGFDAEIDFKGISSEIDNSAPFIPTQIDGEFYYVGGTSNTGDSGSFSGLIGSSQQPAGTYAEFFNDEASQDINNVYFNLDINFGETQGDGTEDLAGIRMRFDEGYDADNDGSTSDELMEYRPTIMDLAEKGFEPNENGWYSISIKMSEFLNSGPRGNAGSWDLYQLEELTRIAIASRREYDGLYSLSIDNVLITKGGPINTVD